MSWNAVCTDCSWSYQGDDQITAADALERHARKEQHHVDLKRGHAATS